jgi:hypothetical protein
MIHRDKNCICLAVLLLPKELYMDYSAEFRYEYLNYVRVLLHSRITTNTVRFAYNIHRTRSLYEFLYCYIIPK